MQATSKPTVHPCEATSTPEQASAEQLDQQVRNVIPVVDLDIFPVCVRKAWALVMPEVDLGVEADSEVEDLEVDQGLLLPMRTGLRSSASELICLLDSTEVSSYYRWKPKCLLETCRKRLTCL